MTTMVWNEKWITEEKLNNPWVYRNKITLLETNESKKKLKGK